MTINYENLDLFTIRAGEAEPRDVFYDVKSDAVYIVTTLCESVNEGEGFTDDLEDHYEKGDVVCVNLEDGSLKAFKHKRGIELLDVTLVMDDDE